MIVTNTNNLASNLTRCNIFASTLFKKLLNEHFWNRYNNYLSCKILIIKKTGWASKSQGTYFPAILGRSTNYTWAYYKWNFHVVIRWKYKRERESSCVVQFCSSYSWDCCCCLVKGVVFSWIADPPHFFCNTDHCWWFLAILVVSALWKTNSRHQIKKP